jgi:5-methylcytosine-specific restriction endonuclease McrA
LSNKEPDRERMAKLLEGMRKDKAEKANTYREMALKLYPHLCGRCGKTFSGKTLGELTVHHKDGDHMNNPRDGSNWELLCVQCHENEHGTLEQRSEYEGASTHRGNEEALGFQAFGGLKDLLKGKAEEAD